ncbi:MAG: hypothetical protein MJ133_06455 [Lachnospiraceae bacterium]|nr:hypothetical protein [Lachnospiraceae bacterium]
MGLLKKIKEWKNKISDPLYGYEGPEDDEKWGEIVYNREDLKISDKASRNEYIRGCLEQIAEASREVDILKTEYDDVTSHLKDIEEIEALPDEERGLIAGYARQIGELKLEQNKYQKRSRRMSDAKYRKLERMEDELAEGYQKLKEAEDYKILVKKDLKKLENEKQAYFIRRHDLKRTIDDCKTMSVVCLVAVAACVCILLILQFGFKLNTTIGYLAAALAGAIGITMIFIRNNDSRAELRSVSSGINRLIRLQNTVKIRYVNNTNLLEYLYMKYQVNSSRELGADYEEFLEERREREKYEKAEAELGDAERAFLRELRRFQIKDTMIWLHQTEALLDKREMVEIRHKYIIRRQSLRRRMDYNKEVVALNAQNEIKDIVDKYPKYAKEILDIVSEYESAYK